jgi:hypothetical protein
MARVSSMANAEAVDACLVAVVERVCGATRRGVGTRTATRKEHTHTLAKRPTRMPASPQCTAYMNGRGLDDVGVFTSQHHSLLGER